MRMPKGGIVHVTGEHDTGKTFFALENSHPKNTAFFHDDVKLPPVDAKEFGLWVDMVKLAEGKKLFEFREEVLSILYGMQDNQFNTIVFDTWTRFETSIINWAIANSSQFREPDAYIMRHEQKVMGAQRWRDAYEYEASIVSLLAQKAKCVFLITHLKDHSLNGVKTEKQIPDSSKVLDKACNLRLWFRHNNNHYLPVVLVLKRLSDAVVTKSGFKPVNILPRRIEPRENEKSIWDIIDRYRSDPFMNREPREDEIPNSHELSILDGLLTKDQREVWKANLSLSKLENNLSEEEQAIIRVKELNEQGVIIPQIMTTVNSEFPSLNWDIGRVSKELRK